MLVEFFLEEFGIGELKKGILVVVLFSDCNICEFCFFVFFLIMVIFKSLSNLCCICKNDFNFYFLILDIMEMD